jgi:hypothetical protein
MYHYRLQNKLRYKELYFCKIFYCFCYILFNIELVKKIMYQIHVHYVSLSLRYSIIFAILFVQYFFLIILVYLQSVQVHSVNWLKEVGEFLGEGRSLALFYS